MLELEHNVQMCHIHVYQFEYSIEKEISRNIKRSKIPEQSNIYVWLRWISLEIMEI